MCFICIVSIIIMRSISMCIYALFDFSYVRNSYMLNLDQHIIYIYSK